MIIKTVVMAHPSRKTHANDLKRMLDAQKLYADIIWDNKNDEWDTGRRCLIAGLQADWTIILQDDAIVAHNFADNAIQAINKAPHKTLISFYTGTTKPYPAKITRAVTTAMETSASWLMFDRLCWGVGIAIKSAYIKPLMEKYDTKHIPYDEKIGAYFHYTKQPVYYCFPSIVDHRDEQSLVRAVHNYSRVAHRFSREAHRFNGGIVNI